MNIYQRRLVDQADRDRERIEDKLERDMKATVRVGTAYRNEEGEWEVVIKDWGVGWKNATVAVSGGQEKTSVRPVREVRELQNAKEQREFDDLMFQENMLARRENNPDRLAAHRMKMDPSDPPVVLRQYRGAVGYIMPSNITKFHPTLFDILHGPIPTIGKSLTLPDIMLSMPEGSSAEMTAEELSQCPNGTRVTRDGVTYMRWDKRWRITSHREPDLNALPDGTYLMTRWGY